MQKKINKVADWIVNESDDSVDEVMWLLEQVYIPSDNRTKIDFDEVICPNIEEDYDGVFEHLKHKKLLNFLGKEKKDAFLKELDKGEEE